MDVPSDRVHTGRRRATIVLLSTLRVPASVAERSRSHGYETEGRGFDPHRGRDADP